MHTTLKKTQMLRCAASLVVATYAKSTPHSSGFARLASDDFYKVLKKGDLMKSYIQISTTTETKEEAQKIAQYLVEQKLAACVQITGPIESTYRWRGNVETANEWLCLIKTREALFNKAQAAIKKLHSYETPEIIAVPIVKGSKEYLNWMDDGTENKS
jgi:periplasmic divalent cation tolerance protein